MSEHILLIEDNEDDLEFYVDLLSRSEKERVIHTTDSLEDAVELFGKHDIRCTFIDYNLPGLNGIKVLDKLGSLTKGRVLAAVILTGEPNQTIQAEAARHGAIDYIVKDVTNTSDQIEKIIDSTCSWANSLNKSD